jgi:hypothetical protein
MRWPLRHAARAPFNFFLTVYWQFSYTKNYISSNTEPSLKRHIFPPKSFQLKGKIFHWKVVKKIDEIKTRWPRWSLNCLTCCFRFRDFLSVPRQPPQKKSGDVPLRFTCLFWHNRCYRGNHRLMLHSSIFFKFFTVKPVVWANSSIFFNI